MANSNRTRGGRDIRQLDRDVRADDFPETAELTQLDVDRNYGGDRVKAVMLQAIENRRPLTHIRLEMSEEPQGAYDKRAFGEFKFHALLIAGAATYEAVQNQQVALPEGIEINGDKDGEKPIVRLTTTAGLKYLVDRILEHRSRRTYSRQDAIDALRFVKGEIGRLKSQNATRLSDFKPADATVEQAETVYGKNSFREDRDKLDWKPVVDMAYQGLDEAFTVVQTWMHKRATGMLNQVKDRVEDGVVRQQIADALAIEDKRTSIGKLWGIVKDLRTTGADDPAFTRQGLGNRPESTGGSHERNRFQQQQRPGANRNSGGRGSRFERREQR